MATALHWIGDDEEPVPASFPSTQHRTRGRRTPALRGEVPAELQATVWRGSELGSPISKVVSSGFPALDAELPGGGCPCHGLTEVLQPEELVARARQLGYAALAVADECSMAGIVRAHVAARQHKLKLLVGAQFRVDWNDDRLKASPFSLTVLACNLNGYGNLCKFITKLRRASEKGNYRLDIANITGPELDDCVVLASPQRMCELKQLDALARWLLDHFLGRCWFGVDLLRLLDDEMWLHRLRQVSRSRAIPLVATRDVQFHVRSRKPLQDVLTATRIGKPLTACGLDRQPNAERHLRTRMRLAQTYPADLLAQTLLVAARCIFNLDELRYQYPDEVVPEGETSTSYLRRITYEGAGRRWPRGMPAKVQSQIEDELELIKDLKYEHYFLTVADIVAFERSRHILCQERGSAANSVVCYCIGVTEAEPARMSVLFERFISRERNEPPDIDIDFEHERRNEVLQYLYAKYGLERAAITGVVISYRPKSAIRDVGKALGFPLRNGRCDCQGPCLVGWIRGKEGAAGEGRPVHRRPAGPAAAASHPAAARFPASPEPAHRRLRAHPRSVVAHGADRERVDAGAHRHRVWTRTRPWMRSDCSRFDCLALGMLTAIRKALDFIGQRKGYTFEMQDIPAEDPETYDVACKADTVGVFQIESRAQMSMLPRLQPSSTRSRWALLAFAGAGRETAWRGGASGRRHGQRGRLHARRPAAPAGGAPRTADDCRVQVGVGGTHRERTKRGREFDSAENLARRAGLECTR